MNADPSGVYLIKYEAANPWFYKARPQKMRVKGKRNMEVTRKTLRESGYRVLDVTRKGWFS